jgi:hypothetical protein
MTIIRRTNPLGEQIALHSWSVLSRVNKHDASSARFQKEGVSKAQQTSSAVTSHPRAESESQ